MRAVIKSLKRINRDLGTVDVREIGTVDVRNGRAEPSNAKIGEMLSKMHIVEPGHPEHVLTFEDGAEYVKALEANIAGTRMWAEVEP
jgi:hypothetical protein